MHKISITWKCALKYSLEIFHFVYTMGFSFCVLLPHHNLREFRWKFYVFILRKKRWNISKIFNVLCVCLGKFIKGKRKTCVNYEIKIECFSHKSLKIVFFILVNNMQFISLVIFQTHLATKERKFKQEIVINSSTFLPPPPLFLRFDIDSIYNSKNKLNFLYHTFSWAFFFF